MRTYVYVDGFNLYYQVKSTIYKWLDLKALSQRLLPPPHNILSVKYFTARVSGEGDTDRPKRQHIYISALETINEISTFYGRFEKQNKWRPITSLPIGNLPMTIGTTPPNRLNPGIYSVNNGSTTPPKLRIDNPPVNWTGKRKLLNLRRDPDNLRVVVAWHEEKGSDVNLASHLLNDAWNNKYDVAAVISNDTDLEEPIKMVTQERKKSVIIISPNTLSVAYKLTQAATSTLHIRSQDLRKSQLPNPVIDRDGNPIYKPAIW